MKLYLKRALSTFIFLNALIILTGIFTLFTQQIFFFVELPTETLYLIGSVPALLLMLYLAYLVRWENKSFKQLYFDTQIVTEYSFRKDYIATLRARENAIHTLAFLSIVLVNSIRIATSVHTPFIMFVLKVVILLLVRGTAFSALNTLVWCFVHKEWLKGRSGVK